GKIVTQAEQTKQTRLALFHLHSRYGIKQLRGHGVLQRLTTVASGVADVQNSVADRVVIKLPEVRRQFQSPGTDNTSPLERQVSIISEVEFENAGIILARTRHDGLYSAHIVSEARILDALPQIGRASCRER